MGSGVVEFKDEVWRRMLRSIEAASSNATVEVGILAEAGEHDGGISMIELAAIHEFGSPAAGIPQRSFIRATAERTTGELATMCGKLVTEFVQGTMPIERQLGKLGAWFTGQIRQTIKKRLTTGPEAQANAESTVRAKGSSLPLVDTGRLLGSLTWKVNSGDE